MVPWYTSLQDAATLAASSAGTNSLGPLAGALGNNGVGGAGLAPLAGVFANGAQQIISGGGTGGLANSPLANNPQAMDAMLGLVAAAAGVAGVVARQDNIQGAGGFGGLPVSGGLPGGLGGPQARDPEEARQQLERQREAMQREAQLAQQERLDQVQRQREQNEREQEKQRKQAEKQRRKDDKRRERDDDDRMLQAVDEEVAGSGEVFSAVDAILSVVRGTGLISRKVEQEALANHDMGIAQPHLPPQPEVSTRFGCRLSSL
jgi:hypothetical protein